LTGQVIFTGHETKDKMQRVIRKNRVEKKPGKKENKMKKN